MPVGCCSFSIGVLPLARNLPFSQPFAQRLLTHDGAWRNRGKPDSLSAGGTISVPDPPTMAREAKEENKARPPWRLF